MVDDEVLTADEIAQIEELAKLIGRRPKGEWEGTLVAAYDYLEALVNGPDFVKRNRMVLLSLLPLVTGVKDSTEVQKATDVEERAATAEEEEPFRKVAGVLPFAPDRFMLLHVERGSTKWVVYTSTGAIVFKKKKP